MRRPTTHTTINERIKAASQLGCISARDSGYGATHRVSVRTASCTLNMITFSVSKTVIALLHAECQSGVSLIDLERALNSRIRETINSLGFANDPKALSKLSIDKALTFAKFSERQVATVNAEARPWLAFVSFSRSVDRLSFDWPGAAVGSLPNTAEFETLRAWAHSLRPRAEKPTEKSEEKPTEQSTNS